MAVQVGAEAASELGIHEGDDSRSINKNNVEGGGGAAASETSSCGMRSGKGGISQDDGEEVAPLQPTVDGKSGALHVKPKSPPTVLRTATLCPYSSGFVTCPALAPVRRKPDPKGESFDVAKNDVYQPDRDPKSITFTGAVADIAPPPRDVRPVARAKKDANERELDPNPKAKSAANADISLPLHDVRPVARAKKDDRSLLVSEKDAHERESNPKAKSVANADIASSPCDAALVAVANDANVAKQLLFRKRFSELLKELGLSRDMPATEVRHMMESFFSNKVVPKLVPGPKAMFIGEDHSEPHEPDADANAKSTVATDVVSPHCDAGSMVLAKSSPQTSVEVGPLGAAANTNNPSSAPNCCSGTCFCTRASKVQDCPQCQKMVHVGDCIMHVHNRWQHVHCPVAGNGSSIRVRKCKPYCLLAKGRSNVNGSSYVCRVSSGVEEGSYLFGVVTSEEEKARVSKAVCEHLGLPRWSKLLVENRCEEEAYRLLFQVPQHGLGASDRERLAIQEVFLNGILDSFTRCMDAKEKLLSSKKELEPDGLILVLWAKGGFAGAGVYKTWALAKEVLEHMGMAVPYSFWIPIPTENMGWEIMSVIYGRPVLSVYACKLLINALAPQCLTNLDVDWSPDFLRMQNHIDPSMKFSDAFTLDVQSISKERRAMTDLARKGGLKLVHFMYGAYTSMNGSQVGEPLPDFESDVEFNSLEEGNVVSNLSSQGVPVVTPTKSPESMET